MTNKEAVFTISSLSYLSGGLSLFESLYKTQFEREYYYFLSDAFNDEIELLNKQFPNINFISFEIIDNLVYDNLILKYDPLEFHVALKPFVFQYLIEIQNFDKVLYFDPDIFIYNNVEKYYEKLNNYNIIITPHFTDNNSNLQKYYYLSRFGIFNLGFIGINKQARNFITWWKNVNDYGCYNIPSLSMFVDQKWIDQVPVLFDQVLIYKSKNANIAYWNYFERDEILCEKNFNNIEFIHFSGFNPYDLSKSSKYSKEEFPNNFTKKIYFEYSKLLIKNQEITTIEIPKYFRFSRTTNKKVIDNYSRKIKFTNNFQNKILKSKYSIKILDEKELIVQKSVFKDFENEYSKTFNKIATLISFVKSINFLNLIISKIYFKFFTNLNKLSDLRIVIFISKKFIQKNENG